MFQWKWGIYTMLLPIGSGSIIEGEAEWLQMWEVREDLREAMSFGYDRTAPLLYSEQLLLLAQDQANQQSMDWQEVRKPSLLTKELWKLMTSSGGGHPAPTGLALICYLNEVQGLLFWVLQLVGIRGDFPILMTTEPALPSGPGIDWWVGSIFPLPMSPQHRWDIGTAVLYLLF